MTTAKKPPAKSAKFPFPFFGQGDAGYYEWFEMFVWFAAPVPEAKRAALVKMAPKLCRLDAQWPTPELLWPSTGDQWIQQHLVEEYGTAAAKKKMKKAMARRDAEDGDDECDLEDRIAQGGETKQFNADIEEWLLAVHAKQPILFAARREDGEAGGTRLGAWHKASVKMYAAVVQPVLEAVAQKRLGPDDLRRAAISIVVNYVGAKNVLPTLRELGDKAGDGDETTDGAYEVKAIPRTSIWTSVAETRKAIARGEIYRGSMIHQNAIDPTNPQHCETLLALDEDELRALVPSECPTRVSSWRVVQSLFLCAHRLALEGRFREALRLYDAVTCVPGHFDPTLYMNALWAVQNDNHHLGVMRERATVYLERCVQYGPRNPGIYYNAACVWQELGDREKAIACVRDAVRHGYDRLDLVRNDAALASLASDPRFLTAFEDPSLLAERKERVWPEALVALRALNGDWCEIDFEALPAMESPEETAEWLRAWTGNASLLADRLRVFGEAGTGGKVAFWRQDPARPLEREPIVFLGSEGSAVVVARDLADFLVLFGRNLGPHEVVEQGAEDADLPGIAKIQGIVKRFYPRAAARTVAQIRADAKAATPEFETSVRKPCG